MQIQDNAEPLAKEFNEQQLQPAAEYIAKNFEREARRLAKEVGPLAVGLPKAMRRAVQLNKVRLSCSTMNCTSNQFAFTCTNACTCICKICKSDACVMVTRVHVDGQKCAQMQALTQSINQIFNVLGANRQKFSSVKSYR